MYKYTVTSKNNKIFNSSSAYSRQQQNLRSGRDSYGPVTIAGDGFVLFAFDKNKISYVSTKETKYGISEISGLPSAARVFVDAAAYLWGKDIYLIFVGTGIIFSRTLDAGDFGYLDTTSVLGTITQFGYWTIRKTRGRCICWARTQPTQSRLQKLSSTPCMITQTTVHGCP